MFLTILLSILMSFAPLQVDAHQVCDAQSENVELKQHKNIQYDENNLIMGSSDFGFEFFNYFMQGNWERGGDYQNIGLTTYNNYEIQYTTDLGMLCIYNNQNGSYEDHNCDRIRYVKQYEGVITLANQGFYSGKTCHKFLYTLAFQIFYNEQYVSVFGITYHILSFDSYLLLPIIEMSVIDTQIGYYDFYYYLENDNNMPLRKYFVPYVPNDNEYNASLNYSLGFDDGYNQGREVGISEGEQNALNPESSTYQTIYNRGKQIGYSEGLQEAQDQDTLALQIFSGCVEIGLLPINVMLRMFEYEIFGINVAGFVSALLTIAIVIIVIRVVTGKKDD